MTNTESPAQFTFAEMVGYDVFVAERAYDKVRAEVTAKVTAEGFVDFAHMLSWDAFGMVRAQFKLRALKLAERSGDEAFADVVGSALAASGRSTSVFSNAVVDAEREEAASLLSTYGAYLSAAALLRLTSRF